MSFKPTVIGFTDAPDTGNPQAPTRLDGLVNPAPVRPVRATALPGTHVQASPTRLNVPAATTQEPQHVHASSLPGTQRKPLDVSYADLAKRFPGTEPLLLERTQLVLHAVTPQAMSSTGWLKFGVDRQEDLAALVKRRLEMMESNPGRATSQHLRRLHTLLREVLDAMDGGFFRKSASKVWESVEPEVRQLDALLHKAVPALSVFLGEMDSLKLEAQRVGASLFATSLAAEYLMDVVGPEVHQVLSARALSLTTSQALVREQQQMLELDKEQVQELATLVQDGVLVQLPSVYSQLAGLSAKTSDTQRYLAADKLNEIVQFIQRKI
ncbi:hypothetical protein [Paraburkholderia sp. A3RO-2L]|uniref:hypothetical protein n=1 Tax=Paraburkholderia sp. A3RO-2L TaxID=3028376 RepID=UPI003DA8492C